MYSYAAAPKINKYEKKRPIFKNLMHEPAVVRGMTVKLLSRPGKSSKQLEEERKIQEKYIHNKRKAEKISAVDYKIAKLKSHKNTVDNQGVVDEEKLLLLSPRLKDSQESRGVLTEEYIEYLTDDYEVVDKSCQTDNLLNRISNTRKSILRTSPAYQPHKICLLVLSW